MKSTDQKKEGTMENRYKVIECAVGKNDTLTWKWAVYFDDKDSVGVFPTRALARMWKNYLNLLDGEEY